VENSLDSGGVTGVDVNHCGKNPPNMDGIGAGQCFFFWKTLKKFLYDEVDDVGTFDVMCGFFTPLYE
jgi:hypothetical protein